MCGVCLSMSVLGASRGLVKMADNNNNKGTSRRKKTEVCGHCNSRVDQGICCDCCRFWVHFTCRGLTKEEGEMWAKLGARAEFYCSLPSGTVNRLRHSSLTALGP